MGYKQQKQGSLKIAVFLLYCIFFVVNIAFASTEGHEVTFSDWFWRIVNFLILVAILVIFAGKPFRNFLKNRSEAIEKALNEARQARELAEKALKEVEERFAQRDAEIEKVLSTARKAGELERDNIIEEGRRMSQRIVEEAKAGIELEKKKAIEKLKEEAAILAIELAEKKLKEGLSEDQKRRLLEDSIKRLKG